MSYVPFGGMIGRPQRKSFRGSALVLVPLANDDLTWQQARSEIGALFAAVGTWLRGCALAQLITGAGAGQLATLATT